MVWAERPLCLEFFHLEPFFGQYSRSRKTSHQHAFSWVQDPRWTNIRRARRQSSAPTILTEAVAGWLGSWPWRVDVVIFAPYRELNRYGTWLHPIYWQTREPLGNCDLSFFTSWGAIIHDRRSVLLRDVRPQSKRIWSDAGCRSIII